MKLKSGEELIKYLTERAVGYMETPRVERKQQRALYQESWSYRWFGLIPIAFGIWMKNRRVKK